MKTDDTVPMLIWSATENTVTIMCSSIPVLRPLYVRWRYGSKGESSGGGTPGPSGLDPNNSKNNNSYRLPTIGGSGGNSKSKSKSNKSYLGSSTGEDEEEDLGTKIAKQPNGAHNRTVITYNADNASDESILRDTRVAQSQRGGDGIMRTDQVHVTYDSKLDV